MPDLDFHSVLLLSVFFIPPVLGFLGRPRLTRIVLIAMLLAPLAFALFFFIVAEPSPPGQGFTFWSALFIVTMMLGLVYMTYVPVGTITYFLGWGLRRLTARRG